MHFTRSKVYNIMHFSFFQPICKSKKRNSARREPRPMAWVETMIVELPVKTEDVEIGSTFVTVGQDLAIQIASVWTNGTQGTNLV